MASHLGAAAQPGQESDAWHEQPTPDSDCWQIAAVDCLECKGPGDPEVPRCLVHREDIRKVVVVRAATSP